MYTLQSHSSGSTAEQEELENLKETFVRNVGHELRTPLAVMQGYAELLHSGELGNLAPEQEQALFVIVNRAYEMRTLVERVGVLLTVEAGTNVLIPLEIKDLVADVLKERTAAAEKAGVTVDVRIAPDLPTVSGDPVQLRHAIDSLLQNAVKFTPRGGQIEIAGYMESGWACLAISDTGIGIPADKLEHLFDGFYQVDGSTTRRYGGLGLGLTVARRVIEAHGGHIAVESQVGVGSRFVIRLPVSRPGEPDRFALPDDVSLQLPVEASTPVRRILVVDDEVNVALILQESLERLPRTEVAMANSGEQALQLFAQQPFDLLITDYKMPGTDGMTLAKRVRQSYPATAIVMLTAYSSDELREQALQTSIQHILDKPVKLAEVRAVAEEALRSAPA